MKKAITVSEFGNLVFIHGFLDGEQVYERHVSTFLGRGWRTERKIRRAINDAERFLEEEARRRTGASA